MKRTSRSRRLVLNPLETRVVPAGLNVSPEYLADRIIVRADAGLPPTAVATASTPLGLGLYSVVLAPGTSVRGGIAAFAGLPGVAFAEPDYIVHADLTPNDPSFGSLYGLNNTGQSGGTADADIDAPEAWNVATGSGTVVVAIIDTGIDYNHPDLAANMWRNPGETAGDGIDNDGNGRTDDIYGFDFANNDNNPMDDNGHGSHTAGTVGAVGNNGVGVAGVSWNVKLMALKFLGSNGSGSTSAAVSCLNYAVAKGAKVSNNSWGGGGSSSTMITALNAARTAGHIFVAAAGNNSSNNDSTPNYPSNYSQDNVVAVAATDRNDNLASYSNYGATQVDLAAPGSSILSTYMNGQYATLSGTSMATPHVAGAAALVWDAHPTWTYDQVITALKSTVDVKSSLQGKVATNGRLNLDRAVRYGGVADVAGPRVTAAAFSPTPTTNISSLRVTFNEAVNPSSFVPADVALTGPGGGLTVTGVAAVSGTGNTQFDIAFASQTAVGTYTAVVGPNVTDVAGNNMDQNQNGSNGEAADTYTASTTIVAADVAGPRVTAGQFNPNATTNINSLRLTFNEAINPSSFVPADVALTGPGGGLTVTGVAAVSGTGNTQFDIAFAGQTAVGTYTAVVGPNVTDAAGNNMDQNQNGSNGEAADTYTATTTIVDVAGPRVTAGAWAPGGTSVSSLRVTFNEAVNPSSFVPADVALTGPGGGLTVTGVAAVAGSGNTQFDIAFAGQTAVGTYTAVVGPNVTDVAGNNMDQNQNGSNGEAADTYTASTAVSSSATRTYTSTDVPKAIGFTSRTVSTLAVADTLSITDLNVKFTILYPYDAFLKVTLIGPDGTQVVLVNQRGGFAPNFTNTILDDEAVQAIAAGAAPFTGTYRPEAALSAFDGKAVGGTWQLVVDQVYTFGTSGSAINAWSITATGTP